MKCTRPTADWLNEKRTPTIRKVSAPPGTTPWRNLTPTTVKPLYTFGKTENYSAAARANVDVKQGDVRLRRGEPELEVKRAY